MGSPKKEESLTVDLLSQFKKKEKKIKFPIKDPKKTKEKIKRKFLIKDWKKTKRNYTERSSK